MAITSFIPSIWEQSLITNFRGVSVANLITTPPTKVEGGKAIFNQVSGGTIKDYTGSVDYDSITTAPKEVVYDKKKYFAITLDDVDRVQAAGELLNPVVKEKALDLKEVVDADVFAKAISVCPTGNKIGTTAAKIDLNTKKVYDLIVDLGVKLSKKKVPNSNRFVLASSEYVQELAKDPRFTSNFTILENGIVQGASVNGMTVVQTEDLPANTILCLHKSALGFGMEIDDVEALRLQTSFADAVRGLEVYGIGDLRPDGIAMAYVEFKTV
ncbi:hypothetical protein [Clostridium sp. UBA5988]|uniref:hypothetical protein n=1 Tax=Clostridium sp. UBA5988 TaxID=1946369 RepID=UPI003217F92C